MPGHVIMVVRSWPRLSQSFIVDEVVAMERRGLELTIVSLARSGERRRHPQLDAMRAMVLFLDAAGANARWTRILEHARALAGAPGRYLRTLGYALFHPRLSRGYSTYSTTRCFDHAVAVAGLAFRLRRSGAGAPHIHAHFAHDPALVGMLASRLTGLTFSFTAHAEDLYRIPPASLVARVTAANAVVTCCQANAAYIARNVPRTVRPPVRVIHHGVELDRFRPARRPSRPDLTLVAIGPLTEEHGYVDLLRACAALAESGHRFTCEVYGDGPLRRQLIELSVGFGLAGQVSFRGERSRDEIGRVLAGADIFVVTPDGATDDDADGRPNVIVDAMASGVPVVTTAIARLPELVRSGQNALVAPPGDVETIAAHLAALLTDPALRRRIGEGGRRTVEARYDVEAAASALETVFGTGTSLTAEVAP